MPKQFSSEYGYHTAFEAQMTYSSDQIRRTHLLVRAYEKHDNTFPGYGKSQYAREALEYLSNDQLQEYIHTKEPKFSFSFIFSLIFLEILSLDSETLSAFCIIEKAISVEKKVMEELEKISIMRNEHYRKYGTFFEKIKSYILN